MLQDSSHLVERIVGEGAVVNILPAENKTDEVKFGKVGSWLDHCWIICESWIIVSVFFSVLSNFASIFDIYGNEKQVTFVSTILKDFSTVSSRTNEF